MADEATVIVQIDGDFTAAEQEKELRMLRRDLEAAGVEVRTPKPTTAPPPGVKAGVEIPLWFEIVLATGAHVTYEWAKTHVIEKWNDRHRIRGELRLTWRDGDSGEGSTNKDPHE